MTSLLVRAHSGPTVGAGHAMRSLALAEGWSYGPAHMVLTDALPRVAPRLEMSGVGQSLCDAPAGSAADAQHLVDQARQLSCRHIVLDGYCFDTAYQRLLKEHDLEVLMVDDYGHAGRYEVDWVLNQNASADASLYRNRHPRTELLLGLDYVLLRQEFRRYASWQRTVREDVLDVLVSLGGGGDDATDLQALLEGLSSQPYRIRVIGLKRPPPGLESIENVTDMAALMADCDISLSAAGSTVWEQCFMGLPTVLVVRADNQRPVVESATAAGVAISLGDLSAVTAAHVRAGLDALRPASKRLAMSQGGRRLVDGEGVSRVVKRLARDFGDAILCP